MAKLDKSSGKKVLDAMRQGMEQIAIQIFDENPRDYHKRGRIMSFRKEGYVVSVNDKIYTRVPAINGSIKYTIGDVVEIMVPNGQMSQMFIMGRLVDFVEGISDSGSGGGISIDDVYKVLQNYVSLSGEQTVIGKKTFTGGLYATTPSATDISTIAATTEWVKNNYQTTCYVGRDNNATDTRYFKIGEWTVSASSPTYRHSTLIGTINDVDTPIIAQFVVSCTSRTATLVPVAELAVYNALGSAVSYTTFYATHLYVTIAYTAGTYGATFQLWYKTDTSYQRSYVNILAQSSRSLETRPWTIANDVVGISQDEFTAISTGTGHILVSAGTLKYGVFCDRIEPNTDSNVDLGSKSKTWNNIFVNTIRGKGQRPQYQPFDDAMGVSNIALVGDIDTATHHNATKIDDSDDLNLFRNPGWYYAVGGNSVTNKPSGVGEFGLEVIRAANGVFVQRLTYGNKLYQRTNYSSSWNSWIEFANTDDIPTKLSQLTNDSNFATVSQVNAKYTKPSGGIPKSDLASSVQTSLGKADTAFQGSMELQGTTLYITLP